jgi:guanylate kinase
MSAPGRKGVALVVCAPSGAGKTTLVRRLLQEFDRFAYSVSCTTRAPRTGERDGRDYHFLQKEEFERLRDQGHFAEWALVHGNYYGTPLASVRENLDAGRDMLFDIDVQGAAQLKEKIPACFVFILPPSYEVLRQRLSGRGTDSPETIARRLAAAAKELMQAHWFDALVINDNLDQAYDELRAVYVATTLAPGLDTDFLPRLLETWNKGT